MNCRRDRAAPARTPWHVLPSPAPCSALAVARPHWRRPIVPLIAQPLHMARNHEKGGRNGKMMKKALMDVAHAATAWLNGTVARPPQPHMHKAIALSRLREPIASNRATVPGCIRARRIQPRRHARRPGRARPPAACSAGHSRRRPPTMATRPLRRSHSTSIRSVDCPPRPWCPLAAVTPHLAPPPPYANRAGRCSWSGVT